MKKILIIISFVICLASTIIVNGTTIQNNTKRIIIDAGHGGYDPGAVYFGKRECDLNLEISMCLKKIFEENGYIVSMTREEDIDLCENEFIKRNDLNKRIELINGSQSMLCLSIHMNSFVDSQYHGAQVFYASNNKENSILADKVMNNIKKIMKNTDRKPLVKDNIYMLKKISIPTIIVECGFMTNYDELKKLLDFNYQYLLCTSIFYGVEEYLMNNNP